MSQSSRGPSLFRRQKGGKEKPKVELADTAKFALQVVANVADGAVVLPGMKAAAQLAIQIIDVAQKVKSNKEDCMTVAQRALDLMTALIEATQGKVESDINDRFKADLTKFGSDLEKIHTSMLALTSQSLMYRVVKHSQDVGQINSSKETLDHYVKIFQVHMQTGTRVELGEVHLDVKEIKERLGTAFVFQSQNLLMSSTPPAAPSIFFGRDDLVGQAVACITTVESARIAILGAGGMGKTALALTILHHEEVQQKFSKKCFFVPCDAATSSELLVASILQVLGAQKASDGDPLTLLHNVLTSLGPILLVLDNFETPWETLGTEGEELLQRIAVAQVTLIVTMRGSLSPAGIQWTQQEVLSVLSLENAHKAFLAAKSSMQHSQPEVEQELLRHLDCVPLAVMLTAQLAKSQKCSTLLERWKKEKTALLKLRSKNPGRLSSIDVSISLSVKSIQDEPEVLQLLSLICHLPDGVIEWETTLHKLASTLQKVDYAAATLLDMALAYSDNNQTLKTLSPIRHYILEYHPCSQEQFTMLESYYYGLISGHYHVLDEATFKKAFQMLQPEIGNISSIISYISKDHPNQDMIEAAINISSFLCWTKASTHILDIVMPYATSSEMKQWEPQVNLVMGEILYIQAKYAEAIDRLTSAEKQFEESGHKMGATQCVRRLGGVFHMQGRYSEATEALERAEKLFLEMDNQLGATRCVQSLAGVLYMQNKYTEATEKLESAEKYFDDYGDQLAATQCIRSLGDILRMQNRFSEATEKLERAEKQFSEIYNQLGVCQCMESLGNILFMQGKYEEAIQKLKIAHEKFTEIDDQLGATSCLQSLANALHRKESYPEAIEQFEKAEKQFNKMGHLKRVAQCMQGIGNILYLQGKYAEATEQLEKAEKQFLVLGDIEGAAQTMGSIGVVLGVQGKYSESLEKLQSAEKQLIQIDDYHGATACLEAQGDILRTAGRYQEAIETLECAEKQFWGLNDHHGASQCNQRIIGMLYLQSRHSEAAEKLRVGEQRFLELGLKEKAVEYHGFLQDMRDMKLIESTEQV